MPSLYFNNTIVEQTSVQKHHDKNFERKSSFTEHINDKISKKSRDYKALLLPWKQPMMNIGNLGSKQSVRVKFKEGSGLKATDIFLILLSQDGFESHFLKSLQKQPYADVFPYGLQLYLKEASTQVFFCEYCEIFTKSFFDRTPPLASVYLFILIKNNLGWFLLSIVDLVVVRYLHIIIRNHFSTLLLIYLQNTKTCPK